MYLFNNPQVEQIITLALNEDIGTGDITTLSTIPQTKPLSAALSQRKI